MTRGLWLLVWLTAGIAPALSFGPDDCTIVTPHGRIIGHRSAVKQEVCEFLGIPYAAPPVGDLRFAPPQAIAVKGDFYANTYGPDCPQNPSKPFPFPNATKQYNRVFNNFVSTTASNNTQSEACLTLNIWVNGNATIEDKRPVLLWVHGGRHSAGTSNTPFYNGATFAASQNAVVVTFNFRLTILGFSGAPGATQNVGLLDQYKAVEWIHDRVQRFGGNPDQIALYGQSSGGVAVSNWAYAFKDRPLVAKTASHSGNQFSFPTNTLELAAKNWYTVTKALGCGSAEDDDTLTCMRRPNITFKAILDAVKTVPAVPQDSPARSQPQFQVTQDNQTFFPPAVYLARARAGDLARLPYLQISNAHESGFYRISALAAGRSLSEDDWAAFERDSFTCPAAAEAWVRARQGILTYRFRHEADWANMRLYEGGANATSRWPDSGAYHGVELHSVLGNSELVSGIAPGEAQRGLEALMTGLWYYFAAEGDVNHAVRPAGWHTYEPGRECLGVFGRDNSAELEFVDPGVYDGLCKYGGYEFWDPAIDEKAGENHD